ncbi:MAG: T9SS C-terminal target domain-containing protein, partial [Chlorobiota bacterium]
ASDHSSFWQHNYSAICFSEAYYGGDFNPYYHSSQDRIDKFNLTYFHNVSKLGIATIAALALENFVVSVPDDGILPSAFSITNYPNPFNSSTIIQYYLTDDDNISLNLYSSLGEKVSNIFTGFRKSGDHKIHLEGNSLSSGVYFIVLRTSKKNYTHKILLLK